MTEAAPDLPLGFDSVGWATERASELRKQTWYSGGGDVIVLRVLFVLSSPPLSLAELKSRMVCYL